MQSQPQAWPQLASSSLQLLPNYTDATDLTRPQNQKLVLEAASLLVLQ